MYDPSIGRWLEEDPLGFEAGDANLYRYVGNGPTDGVDPSGLEPPASPKNESIPNESNMGEFVFGVLVSNPNSRPNIFAGLPAATVHPLPSGAVIGGNATNVSSGSHLFIEKPKPGQYFGTGGCESCVGCIIQCPDGKGAVFHFYTGDDPFATIGQYKWAKRSTAVVFGGNDEAGSRLMLHRVIYALRSNGITVEGYSGDGLYVGAGGAFYQK